MQIKKLKLSGFKSFVDPTELRIEKGLTGVVGPNGCGKSNLLEAIRWVMGENSAKSMRGGGMEDVIFAGTETRPQRQFAEVALHAERETDDVSSLHVGDNDSELEIVRRIERGAGSAYRANGTDVRAKDVALIFADAATGAHSPALVSQGKISNVISSKPTDRREMLEEAAGISGLHVRRKDAEQKLRAAEKNLARLDDILGDMEQRANALRRQAKQAERYKKLSAQITTVEARLIFARWREAAAAADLAKAEAEAAESKVNTAQNAQQSAVAAQNDSARTLGLLRADVQRARDEASESSHRLITLTNERDNLKSRLLDLQAQAQRISDDNAREDQLTRDASNALSGLEADEKRLSGELINLETERPELEKQAERAERAASESEVELAKAVAEEARIQAEIRVANAALEAAEVRHARLANEMERLAQERAEMGDETELKAACDAAIAARETAQKQADGSGLQIGELESQRTSASEARDAAESALASLKAELAGLSSEHGALERELSKAESDHKAIDQVKAAPGYERALAAALGDDLLAAVGEDGDRYWGGSDAVTSGGAPSGSETLLDHVKAPSQLHNRLSQIFVVDSDNGQSLSVGQRLVTKSGALRRWDGFVARDDGNASAERLVRINRLEELGRLLDPAQAKVTDAETALQAQQDAIATVEQQLSDARNARREAEDLLRQALREADQAEEALAWLKKRTASLSERETALKQETAAALAELEDAQKARTSQPDGAAQEQARAALQNQRDAARQQVMSSQAALSGLDQKLSHIKEQKAVAVAQIKSWQDRSGEAETRMAQMTKRAAEIEIEVEKLADRPRVIHVEVEKLQEAQEALNAVVAEKDAALQAAELAQRDHEDRLNQASEELSQAREERAGAKARSENQDLRRVEMGRISAEKFECPAPLLPEKLAFDEDTVGEASLESAELERLTLSRERIGPVNLVAADELEELETEWEKSTRESGELNEAINQLRGSIGSLNREGRQRLLAAFKEVDQHFQRLFSTLFDGGQAHLALIDSDDPLEAGLEIMAQPPGKKLTSLTLLSGGEQALTAVALIFGLFLTNPAPICVLDEVDAPLDDANIERFCDMLDKMVAETNTRYLIVTHNAVTMSRMHRLFGVTMIERGISQLVSVDLDAAEELLAAE
ncbi:chromosome segregation protein SMC [Parasphingorhabdus halotolerans]|uniref:Chromosome partition protein Smc n=1 Tax=Parasphingorhabdus halotolerans TaxID=2725558 RepID=A0A6H2DKH6_9SPHN|nr:chromosome segregation protein SMC [Parasphingorhabdus halotolerans]QJB69182.1 chromosome segregation protein SMC [Parasphingorhabdus halotolerans]